MEKLPEKKVLGILSIVIGAIALILSWIPIVNNFAAVLAVIGVILGLIAFLVNRKHKKLLAWIGTILSVVSFAIVMGTQSMYSNAIDDVAGKNDTQATNEDNSNNKSSQESSTSSSEENKTFNVGDTVEQKNGMNIKVDSVEYKDGGEFDDLDDGKQFVVVHLTLDNKGTKTLDYNEYDYKLDDNGKQTDFDSFMSDENGNDVYSDMLESGSLRPNSSMTGTIIGQAVTSDSLQLVSNAYDNSNNWTINLN